MTAIDVSGPSGRLSVLLDGDPTAPPVLAIHGFGSSARYTWEATGHVRALLAAGRRVIAPDLPGHGDSARPHDPAAYTIRTMVESLQAVVDQVVGGPIDLLGYSLGARLSVALLSAGNPPQVDRVVLGGYDGRPPFDDVDPSYLARIAGAVPGNDLDALDALVAGLSATAQPCPPPVQPTLVVVGSEDPLLSRARSWAAAAPDASFLAVPGRDHISTVTAAAFRRAAAAFLDVDRPRRPPSSAAGGSTASSVGPAG